MLSRTTNSSMRSSISRVRITRNNLFQNKMVSTDTTSDIVSMKETLNNLISSTSRGTNENNRREIINMTESFRGVKSETATSSQDLLGEWELLYTDDDITRYVYMKLSV
jgi:hypothetical protein